MLLAIIALVISYLAGAIPSAYIIVKLIKGIDIRQQGSGNVGFTNALRVIGWGPGLLVLLADIGKGIVAVMAISRLGMMQSNPLSEYMPVLCGFSAIVGHIWTVFLKFHGGKGVATSLGIFIGLYPLAGLISLGVWLIAVAITRYVSLGSILLCITFCIISFATDGTKGVEIWSLRIMAIIVTIIVTYKHKGNIQRLIKGEERKFGQREKTQEQ
jgi:glycerol-3-phosphate acyltransferase PlsY